ncbi:C2 domain-containing protein [Glomus cerebriforme]|uniref:C2 domain-containing protein n=1 Tax=Glomus cerebriforme TaxID=658196 RepID=A0A397SW79_9GLOM|nr:C2 domain-containing protein [Glomus cerebriforme]
MVLMRVTVLNGRDLKDLDPPTGHDLSDPYVELWIENKEDTVMKTEVKSHTNNPEWNESFTFDCNLHEKLCVQARERDNEKGNSDDLIGCRFLHIESGDVVVDFGPRGRVNLFIDYSL